MNGLGIIASRMQALQERAEKAEATLAQLGWKPNGWWCDECDRIDPFCPHCKGGGMDPASGGEAYAPCEECGGDGRQHCAWFYGCEGDEVPPFGERAKLRAALDAERAKGAA
jgi:hypothetical protein